MDGVTLKTEAHQKRIDFKYALQVGKDRNRSAATRRNRLDAVNLCHSLLGSLVCRRRYRDQEAVSAMMRDNLNLDIIRSDRKEMLCEKPCDGLAVLIRDKPHGYLRMSHRRKHSLRTLACVATPYTVHIKARTDAGTLQRRVSGLTLDLLDVQEFLILLDIERSARKLSPVLSGKLDHIIIEPLDGNMTILVDKRRDHVAKHIDRVRDSSAVMS